MIVLDMLRHVSSIVKCECRRFVQHIKQVYFFFANNHTKNNRLIIEMDKIKLILTFENNAELFFFQSAILVWMLARRVRRGLNPRDPLASDRRGTGTKHSY